MTRTLTTEQILAVQGHAIRTGDAALRKAAYCALGYDAQYGYGAVTPPEQDAALAACARVRLPTFTIVMGDGDGMLLYWCTDDDWDQRSRNARRFDTREDADLEIRAARNSLDEHDRRRQYVTIDETD